MAADTNPRGFAGSLAKFSSTDLTPHIGTEFPASLQLSALLDAQDADVLLKDLATLVSHRGVVFFRNQDISPVLQKDLATRMSTLAGKPASSTLHRHPISEETSELGGEIGVISSMGGIARAGVIKNTRASNGWHSDITFEPVPSDYAILRMHTLPRVGGDTLWASGYEAYDRLSPTFRQFLEGLTAVHNADMFVQYARVTGVKMQDPRGSPENTGTELTAIHPVIRTHPVTGYKTLFVNRSFTTRIVELGPDESDALLDYLFRHIADNHDLQVRYRWEKNDVAIWDNRATLHTATNDYDDRQLRSGDRVCSIGERPFFDAGSQSRREALGLM